MNRPAGSAAENAVMPLGRVLFEPVRSADPPIISGTAAVSASRANSEALRGAVSLGGGARVFGGGGANFPLPAAARRREAVLRQVAANAAVELGALVRRERAEAA